MLNYLFPSSLNEVGKLLTETDGRLSIVGGGTVMSPAVAARPHQFDSVIDLSAAGIDKVTVADGVVTVGACTRLADLARHKQLGFLKSAVAAIGGPALRNSATVGGNIGVGGDLSAALLSLGTVATLHTSTSIYESTLNEYFEHANQDGVIISALRFAIPSGGDFGFFKLGRRQHNTPTVVTAAVSRTSGNGSTVALVGIEKKPVTWNLEADVFSQSGLLGDILLPRIDSLEILTDSQASAGYRKRMIPVAIRKAIEAA